MTTTLTDEQLRAMTTDQLAARIGELVAELVALIPPEEPVTPHLTH
jgi:ribosomal protein L29